MLSSSLEATNRSLICVVTLEVDLDFCFITYVFEAFTKSSWKRDHYEGVLGLIDVLVRIRVIVVVLETKLIVQFGLKSVKESR